MRAMKDDDVNEAAELHRMGVLNLRAAVWALARFRRQKGRDATPAEVIERFGASRTNAYRVVSEVRLALDSIHREFPDSGISACVETDPGGHATHQPIPESGIPGFPETGTKIPGIRDGIHIRYSESSERDRYTGEIPGFRETGTRLCDDLRRACELLAGNLQTEPLAGALSRSAHLERVRALAADGWRLESAARKFLDPCEVKASIRASRNTDSQLKYLLAIAGNLDGPFEPGPAAPLRPTGTAGGSPPAPPRPTAADRRLAALRADTESWELPE